MKNVDIYINHLDLTEQTKQKCVSIITEKLDKIISPDDNTSNIRIELSKTTNHHQNSESQFRVEARVHNDGQDFYVAAERDDLFNATHETAEEMLRVLKKNVGKRRTLLRRAQQLLKPIFKRRK